ncbi:MAG TPA: UDP-N-acetylenolpyruvoylglucosamine reductase, partial [Azonexus sp.]|nr:UDP-N-acetylenolpyruvoylglucosamine reductase [Azonexus sp.]
MNCQQNIDLSPLNTLALPGKAARYQKITAQEQLTAADLPASERFILGGGSNLVINGDFDGLILHMAIPGKHRLRDDAEAWYIEAG